ncbi:MAG: hypothetical protein IPF47_22905 [Gemmatimonadetes bacterium]|nr:hypothetical protein [Gemmatimonadota bacterium]
MSEDGGANWRKIESFPGVPSNAYVSRIKASQFEANTAYATFTNHQNGDFKPYAIKTTDGGRTWTSINGDLPARGSTHAIIEDFVDPSLLFIGTEFGAFATRWRRTLVQAGRHPHHRRARLRDPEARA